MRNKEILESLREELKNNIDKKYSKSSEIFSKEKIPRYGVRTNIVRKIAKESFKDIKHLDKKEIFLLAEELLKTNFREESIIAIQWIWEIRKNLEEKDFPTLEKFLKYYINDWDKVDNFCLSVLSQFIIDNPRFITKVKKWSESKNLWMRRASAVSFIKGGNWKIHEDYLNHVFEVANKLLEDKEDLVRKGYGWMLKVASQTHQKEVFNFVMKNKDKMPRVALHYAIEKMPRDLKEKAMKNKI